jgi:Ran GTPase-activating protein (RanGAP) involved in mRNA processing and transport
MKLSEGKNLGDAIKNCQNLLSLKLQRNMIDDDLFRFIISGIQYNISLIELDFSHNFISDEG